ncbi:hypothetical protein B9Z55_002380 [Caenorhabditis nigoni]|uniref:Serine/threonine-protein phosphatase n=1 Tax=Caenorhabditis nigoni TaxID=1611254 RepID=A0A2G5VKF6_9PELO|nr:hypothetical protein B9Z55_002380 [Caenorhabditis nigoni]
MPSNNENPVNASLSDRKKKTKRLSAEASELVSLKSCRSNMAYDNSMIDEIQARLAYNLLFKLLECGRGGEKTLTSVVQPAEITTLLDCIKLVFMSQPSCVEIDGPINICGDTHGQFSDVLRMFDKAGYPHRANYLFLGDYVDRGRHSLENILLLFCYKLIFPNHFFLLRGNHECPSINKVYGFYEECSKRYEKGGSKMWEDFQDTFSTMPMTAVIGQRILCMHGGISPRLSSLDKLRAFRRPNYQPSHDQIEIDILWSDPSNTGKGWNPNQRGVSYTFGTDALRKVLNSLNIDLVVRAHQVVQDGYEFFGQRRLVTVFSAPFYCGQFDNAAAVMTVNEDLVCSFQILRPKKYFPKRRIQVD